MFCDPLRTRLYGWGWFGLPEYLVCGRELGNMNMQECYGVNSQKFSRTDLGPRIRLYENLQLFMFFSPLFKKVEKLAFFLLYDVRWILLYLRAG